MLKQLTFKRIFLEPGKTFAVATAPGARMRVIDGIVWATTSGSPEDIWLGVGQEHRVENRGLTVIESAARSIVELLPPPTTGNTSTTIAIGIRNWSQTMNDYVPSIQRVVFAVAACAMSALTLSLTVIAPAQIGPASPGTRVLATAPNAVAPSLDGRPTPQTVMEDSRTRCVL